MIRRYSELRRLETLKERFDYLKLRGVVGQATFGFDRYMNQGFYHSREWKNVRNAVIVRDNGCDLGVDGYEVQPDRVVFYLWPSAGGSKFQFIFRPRYGINAMSGPSVLYDYYNPEANAAVLPVRFNVQ